MTELKITEIEGFKLNPDNKKVDAICRALDRTQGICSCVHEEWNEKTPEEDKKCPCITYRNGEGCHCNLYVKE